MLKLHLYVLNLNKKEENKMLLKSERQFVFSTESFFFTYYMLDLLYNNFRAFLYSGKTR